MVHRPFAAAQDDIALCFPTLKFQLLHLTGKQYSYAGFLPQVVIPRLMQVNSVLAISARSWL